MSAIPSDHAPGVNVAWDGSGHAFILDTIVTTAHRRHVATALVAAASAGARDAGCEWLHVDFEDHLIPFHFDACGFTPTNAGLIRLRCGAPEAAGL